VNKATLTKGIFLWCGWSLILGLLAPATIAASQSEKASQPSLSSPQKLRLLSNRFRVDQAVEKIVFIIDRIPESAPIILVQPDGSKLYAIRQYDGVKWMDANAGDMIEITNPQIGPWQIIGDILPSSEIRLATSLHLNVDPIPNELFVNEKIKLTSSLSFNNKLLRIGQVDDLIKHEVFLRSSSNPEHRNFGAGTFTIGDFIDNGLGLDAKSGDGIFTGRLNLDKPIGHYELLVRVGNKVFEREYDQPLLLRAQPIVVDLLTAAINGQYTLRFISNSKVANLDKMLLQIKVTNADDTVNHYSINGVAPNHLFKLAAIESPGRYKINIDVFGTTVDGRDFAFELKQLKVRIIALPTEVAEKAQRQFNAEKESAFEKKLRYKAIAAERQEADDKTTLIIIGIMVNVIILILGGIIMFLFFRKKKPKVPKQDKKKGASNKELPQ
jgi:uncharacterized protein (TIGR03503 family)